MRKFYITSVLILFLFSLQAQQEADFENFNLKQESFLNGSDGSGGFTSGGFRFLNSWDPVWWSWSGFSVSAVTDNQKRGWENQYSAIPGKGALGTSGYAVSYVIDQSMAEFPETIVSGFFVTNSTYAYWSMKDGDAFSRKFGGVSGNDPDWFRLTIKGIRKDGSIAGKVDFYLADFRFDDNIRDYIVKDWKWVDLTAFGKITALHFSLSSSDNGAWGMNTPAYFCLDQLNHTDQPPVVVNPVGEIIRPVNFKEEITIPLIPVFIDPDSPLERINYHLINVQDTSLIDVSLTTIFVAGSPVNRDAWLTVKILPGKIGQSEVTVSATTGDKNADHTFRVTVEALTDLEPAENQKLKVFPNPFSDRISVYGPGPINSISLIGLNGQLFIEKNVAGENHHELRGLHGFSPGPYVLKITDANGVKTVKLLKN